MIKSQDGPSPASQSPDKHKIREGNMKRDLDLEPISQLTDRAGKQYGFNDKHDPTKPAQFWFQHSQDGLVLFVVFYSLACQWSRCLGCNLPSVMSSRHIDFKDLMAQVDAMFLEPSIVEKLTDIEKVIVSNNGSVLDERTYSSTALIYLVARINQHMPNVKVLSLETRAEFVDIPELEFLSRALKEGQCETNLEIAIGVEAFDARIRNDVFGKGLSLKTIESLAEDMAAFDFRLKCYFMQKPVVDMSDPEAIADIHAGIDFLDHLATTLGISVNMHLNPTYVAKGTPLEKAFLEGSYFPPTLPSVAKAAAYGSGKNLTIYIALFDEGLAVQGGNFLHGVPAKQIEMLKEFNQNQDFSILDNICK